jgi:LPXTG-site transpeptidase (sortase) family protein
LTVIDTGTESTPAAEPPEAQSAASASPTAAAKAPLSPGARLVSTILAIIAGLAVWMLLFVFVFSALIEHHNQSVAYSRLRENLALGTVAPFGHDLTSGKLQVLHDGDAFGLMSIPAAGLSRTVIFEGTTSSDLTNGPGHLPGTVLPGEVGVSTLLGRSTAYGAPFRRLPSLTAGDPITVTTGQGVFHYKVVDVRGPGQPIPGTLASATSRLTLVTAQRGGWGQLWAPTHAIYVDAILDGTALPVGQSTVPTTADAPMQGDNSALVPLVLWLQGLVLAAVATALLARRWGSRQSWLVGSVLLLALLWGATGALLQLLPNLM